MKSVRIFFIYIKRQLKNPAFLAAAIIIPLLIPCVSYIDISENKGFNAGFYCDNNKELTTALKSTEGMVTFIPYESEESLIRDVENESINCGYVIPDTVYEDIISNKKGAIICYKAPSSMLTELVNEELFAEMSRLYAPAIADHFLKENNISYDRDKFLSYYNDYLEQGKAINIEYSYADSPLVTEEEKQISTDSILGLIAVYIMLGGILAINPWIRDEKKSIPFGLMNVVSSVAILTFFSALTLAVVRGLSLNDCLRLSLYGIFVIAYSMVIKFVFNRLSVICGLIPILVLGSLILCPVFIDVTAIIPELGIVRYLFAPFYLIGEASTLITGCVMASILSFFINGAKKHIRI